MLRQIGFFIFILAGIFWWHQVDVAPTAQDAQVFADLTGARGQEMLDQKPQDYESELAAIAYIQDVVFKAAPKDVEIPKGRTREPADLVAMGGGFCFDRSRMMGKFLNLVGLDARHVMVFQQDPNRHPWITLSTPGVQSHAVIEVKTRRGWMVLGSVGQWIGLDIDQNPVSVADLQKMQGQIPFFHQTQAPIYPIFKSPFVYVYGLYSRQGMFYPPFNFVPDIYWPDFAMNVFDIF